MSGLSEDIKVQWLGQMEYFVRCYQHEEQKGKIRKDTATKVELNELVKFHETKRNIQSQRSI